jgi:hypothetical protein
MTRLGDVLIQILHAMAMVCISRRYSGNEINGEGCWTACIHDRNVSFTWPFTFCCLFKGGRTMNNRDLSGKAEGLAEMLGSQALSEEQMLSIVGGTGNDDNALAALGITLKYLPAYEAAKHGGMSKPEALASVFNTLTPDEQNIYRDTYEEKMATYR